MTQPDYLTRLLATYWFAPPVALWRAIELNTAAKESYEHPLLDLGCGDGLIARDLFGTRHPVEVGVDPWADQLRQAGLSGMYHQVDRAEGNHLPYVDKSFATVFSNSVLEHIPEPTPVLREAARVLRPGGHFIFTVPSDTFHLMLDGYKRRAERGDQIAARVYASSVDVRLQHFHYHTPEEWKALLADAGLKLIKSHYYMAAPAVRFWDRANPRYGIGKSCFMWKLLVSPRLRWLGYQGLIKQLVVRSLGQRWRCFYEMAVPDGEKGGGLLVVAERAA